MHADNRLAFRITVFAALLAFIVVTLGAYTRLKDAGLGCPDWPGCYGQLTVPETAKALSQAAQAFPGHVVEAAKAWPEMIHRYVASTLGLLILIIAFLVVRKRNLNNQPVALALATVAAVIFQGLLGKWTVTLRLLPPIVMLHLVGGMTILSLLVLLALRLGNYFRNAGTRNAVQYRPWAAIGLALVVLQIMLGGWTSSNYAALVCPDFPFCHGQLIPAMDFHNAFNVFMSIGPNYEGGVLDATARVTIQMMHRLGGLIVFLYVGWLAAWLLFVAKFDALRNLGAVMLLLLLVQVILGALNVLLLLPLPIAVAHNGVAALLLLSLITLNYSLYTQLKTIG